MPETFYAYDKSTQKRIAKVKPGITGVGSVVFRNEALLLKQAGENKQKDFYLNKILPYKGELEEWYVKHQSFGVDLKLLFFSAAVIAYSRMTGLHNYFKNLPKATTFEVQLDK